jgi:hypothetical protein
VVPPVSASSSEAQTKAQQVLRERMAELERADRVSRGPAVPSAAPAPAPVQFYTPSGTLTPELEPKVRELLRQKISEMRTPERVNVVPFSATAALTPDQEMQVRQILRETVANLRSGPMPAPVVTTRRLSATPTAMPAPPMSPTQETQAREALQSKMAELNGAEAGLDTDSDPQAKALRVLRSTQAELQAGINPSTPQALRILRMERARLNGKVDPAIADRYVAGLKQQVKQQAAVLDPTKVLAEVAALPTSPDGRRAGLRKLDELYRADRISPMQYHQERAKLMAGR